MKNEIKEILDSIKIQSIETNWIELSPEFIQPLLNYITNLQEEKNVYKGSFETMSKNYFEEKTKIDKATEKLETLMPICIMPNNTLIHGTEKAKTIEETLNILQGEDK